MTLDDMKDKIIDCMGADEHTQDSIWRRCGSPQGDDSFLLDSALIELQEDPRIRIIARRGQVLRYQRVVE